MAAIFDVKAARALHAEGKSCNAIARELGVAPSTVSRWAKREGLAFDRAQVAAANAAHAVDLKARRQAIVSRLYGQVEADLDRLEAATFKTLTRDYGGGESPSELDFVPTQAKRDLMQSVSTALTSAARLEAVDGSRDVENAKGLMADIMRGFGLIGGTDGAE